MVLPFLKNPLSKGKGAIPVERVRELTGKGFSEVEVIDILRKENYSPEEIDNALTHALKFAATGPMQQQIQPAEQSKPESALPTLEEITQRSQQPPQLPETSLSQEYYQGYQQNYPTEEYVDYVVQARMGEMTQKITEFSVKVQEIERRIVEVSDRIGEIMNLKNAEQTQILSKIETFREDVGNIDTRIGGLEKAFKETLPALIESVRALTDLVQRLKRES